MPKLTPKGRYRRRNVLWQQEAEYQRRKALEAEAEAEAASAHTEKGSSNG